MRCALQFILKYILVALRLVDGNLVPGREVLIVLLSLAAGKSYV